jgi:hypothetical protein
VSFLSKILPEENNIILIPRGHRETVRFWLSFGG